MSRYAINYAVKPYSTHGILAGLVGANKTVLDVGCNEGYIGRASDPSNRFYGIDYDQNALAVAKDHYTATAWMDLNTSTKLPWEEKFDLILFGDVLEHLLDPLSAYQALVYGYLKPGGAIILSLPNIANWKVRLDLLVGKFDYQETGILDRTHLHFYTYRTAREMFANDTIKVVRVLGGSSVFGPIIHALPFTRSLLAHSIIMLLEYIPHTG